jgi:hypothetical protein
LRHYQYLAQEADFTGNFEVVLAEFTTGGEFQELKMDQVSVHPGTREISINSAKPKEWYPKSIIDLMWNHAAYEADPKGYAEKLHEKVEKYIADNQKEGGRKLKEEVIRKQVELQIALHELMTHTPPITHKQQLLIANVRDTILVHIPLEGTATEREKLREYLREKRGLSPGTFVQLPDKLEYQITIDRETFLMDPKTKDVIGAYEENERIVEIKGDVDLKDFPTVALRVYPGMRAIMGFSHDMSIAHLIQYSDGSGKKANSQNLTPFHR